MTLSQEPQNSTFGDFFRRKRIEQGLTLRAFCQRYNYDPGNISRLERNILTPSIDEERLEGYAKALEINRDSEEWTTFFDLAHTAKGKLPPDIKSDEEVAKLLPAFFRTMRNKKIDKQKLEKLIELLKK